MTPDDLKSMSQDASNFRIDTGTLRGHIDTLTDYIEDELWPKIEELEKRAVKWVPLEERLPERKKECLIFCLRSSIEVGFLSHTGAWWDDEGLSMLRGATHWAELPAPPEEEK